MDGIQAVGMAQELRTLASLAEYADSVLSTHKEAHNDLYIAQVCLSVYLSIHPSTSSATYLPIYNSEGTRNACGAYICIQEKHLHKLINKLSFLKMDYTETQI